MSFFFKIPDSVFKKMNVGGMPDINNYPQEFHSPTDSPIIIPLIEEKDSLYHGKATV